jgi:hypothetical protein
MSYHPSILDDKRLPPHTQQNDDSSEDREMNHLNVRSIKIKE